MRRTAMAPLALSAILLFAAACSPRKMVVSEVAGLMAAGRVAYEQETDLYLLAQSFPAHIKLLEALSVNDPANAALHELIARLYGGYAFAVLETEHEALSCGQAPAIGLGLPPAKLALRMTNGFRSGAESALDAMAVRYPDVRAQIASARGAAAFFASLDVNDVPALFWYGFNLAGYVRHNLDSVRAVSRAHQVEAAMQRVLELDPSYYGYGAHLILMVYYARAPMMGGNPELAQQHYEGHRRAMPQRVRLRELFRARYILVHEQRRDVFTQVMEALAGDVVAHSSLALLDSVAVERAAVYLGSADRFFD